jgi:Xaa-Pro aminopeptidase
MDGQPYQNRLKQCSRFMQEAGLDALLLTKPANMFYLTGDGRLCAYTMITRDGVGIEFEKSPPPPGHAFFHGEKAPPPLPANVVITVGNCGLYTGPWGVRIEDTNLVTVDGPETLTSYTRHLEAR